MHLRNRKIQKLAPSVKLAENVSRVSIPLISKSLKKWYLLLLMMIGHKQSPCKDNLVGVLDVIGFLC